MQLLAFNASTVWLTSSQAHKQTNNLMKTVSPPIHFVHLAVTTIWLN